MFHEWTFFSSPNTAQFGLILGGELFRHGGDKHADDEDADEDDEEKVVICTGMGLCCHRNPAAGEEHPFVFLFVCFCF